MLASYFQKINPYDEYALASSGSMPDDLTLESAREALAQLAVVYVKYDKSSEAFKLYQKIGSKLPALGAEVAAKFDAARTYLGFAAMPYFSLDDAVSFFKERNLSNLIQDYDLVNVPGRISNMLALLPIEERDKWRKVIWQAMRENQNQFVGGKSIGAWLKEYDAAVGYDVADSYQRAQFESQGAVRAHLGDDEKRLLHRLFDLYEFIKLSSESPAGFDEDLVIIEDDGPMLYTREPDVALRESSLAAEGVAPTAAVRPVPPSTPKLAVAPLSAVPFGRVLERSRALLAESSGDVKTVRDALDRALRGKDVETALASLLLLSQLRVLDTLLTDDERFRAMVLDDLKKAGRTDTVDGFAINPTAPQFVARFLKIALEDALGLSHEDAIGFGTKLASVLALEGEKYQSIVREGKWNI